MKIMTEASGSIAAGFLIRSIQDAGFRAVASDISETNAGALMADDYMQLPLKSDPGIWSNTRRLIQHHSVDVVIPSLDDTLLEWTQQTWLKEDGIQLIASPTDTIATFVDKWKAYEFFVSNGIPTPKTSLEQDYRLFKPRFGRGGQGIFESSESVDMTDYLSQEKIEGVEYTVDVLCNKQGDPVYIVPRTREGVISGKSTRGTVVLNQFIIDLTRTVCERIYFIGPVNLQCIVNDDGIFVIEVNPRIASGMALSFAATSNWIEDIVNHCVLDKPIVKKSVRWGLSMYRSYQEYFIEKV